MQLLVAVTAWPASGSVLPLASFSVTVKAALTPLTPPSSPAPLATQAAADSEPAATTTANGELRM